MTRGRRVLPESQFAADSTAMSLAPVASLQLYPGQQAVVPLQWLNWCHGVVDGPLLLHVGLPGRSGSLTVPTGAVGEPVATPRCDTRSARSRLEVGRFAFPQTSSYRPASLIETYYAAVNARHYGLAYSLLAMPDRRPFGTFVAGYRTTASVAITRLALAPYRLHRGRVMFTCLGIQLVARHTPRRVLRYGGWYMAQEAASGHWSIYLPGTRIGLNQGLRVPPASACGAGMRA